MYMHTARVIAHFLCQSLDVIGPIGRRVTNHTHDATGDAGNQPDS